jgi:hypothetical protein
VITYAPRRIPNPTSAVLNSASIIVRSLPAPTDRQQAAGWSPPMFLWLLPYLIIA